MREIVTRQINPMSFVYIAALALVGAGFVYLFEPRKEALISISALILVAGAAITAAVKLHSEMRDRAFGFLRDSQQEKNLLAAMNRVGHAFSRKQDYILTNTNKIYLSNDKKHHEFVHSLFVLGNFFEEMAISIRENEINETIVKEFYVGMLIRFFPCLKSFLPIMRNVPIVDNHPHGDMQRPEVFTNVEWLFDRWFPDYQTRYENSIKYLLRPTANPSDSRHDSYSWTGIHSPSIGKRFYHQRR